MLYKYLFYSISYLIKKYDRYWNVGEIYFFTGAIVVGVIIATSILVILDLIGIFFNQVFIWQNYLLLAYLPAAFGFSSAFFFGYKKRHEKIYESVKNMPRKKKRIYSVLNILHIIIVVFIYLSLGNIIREINLREGASYATFLIELLGIRME